MFFALLPAPAAHAATENEIRNKVYSLVNAKRQALGLRTLTTNRKTTRWAKDHSYWMANYNSLTHDSQAELWAEVPRDAQFRSENIGYLQDATPLGLFTLTSRQAAVSLFQKWMASPGHRANILRRRNTHMGLGIVIRGNKVWATQRFVDRRW